MEKVGIIWKDNNLLCKFHNELIQIINDRMKDRYKNMKYVPVNREI